MVKDIKAGSSSYPSNLSEGGLIGGRLYFSAADGISGSELWTSDGTEAGTAQVKDIDAADAGVMFAVWGHLGGMTHDADMNGDGFVDAADAGRMFSQWDPAQVSSDRLVGRSLVPEPSGIVQLVITAIVWWLNRHTSCPYVEESSTS